jgi:hypothetical protein
MRRLTQLTALATCFLTTAIAAPPLYTVTIKISPAKAGPHIFISNRQPGLENKYSCDKLATTLVCKIPAGAYRVYVAPNNLDYAAYDSGDTHLIVNKSQTFTYELEQNLSTMDMPAANQKPFNDLLLKITGTLLDKCLGAFEPELTRRCARSNMSVENIKQWVGLISSLHQITPWRMSSKSENISSAEFNVNGWLYGLALIRSQQGGNLLIWYSSGDMKAPKP